jgi:hypothetical protein
VLACSFCLDVLPPDWWSGSSAFWLLIPFIAGLVIGFIAFPLHTGRRRTGALLIATGLSVLLPAAVFVVHQGGTQIDYVGSQPPPDPEVDAYRLRCDTALQGDPRDDPWNQELVDACADATSSRRWAGYALLVGAAGSVGAGALLITRPNGRAREHTPEAART